MSDFEDIFADVIRIVTFQPREACMRYRPPEGDERLQLLEKKNARDDVAPDRSPD
ncbi:hypothetical protein [Mesorhizobium sp.]|uniref:hypothetical protein n=1 Tax=Mesorhizobium sp. TaxID=1871066 RepID=UPI0025F00A42|nr:hypothetical protein [Mesorhizobium sp.]